jgi:hypothetical protein
MGTFFRWTVVAVLVFHGAIHLLGAAKGLGWAKVDQLKSPVSTAEGIAWLVAAALVLITAVLIALGRPSWWWAVAAVAAVFSQAVIFTAWSDAKAGTIANVLLLVVAVLGFAALGPTSLRAHWQAAAQNAIQSTAVERELVAVADLEGLPAPLAEYIRRSGALGEPRVYNFSAEVRGRIRGGTDKPWMEFTGRQVSTYGQNPQRLLLMNASVFGMPITMTHLFDESSARMHGKLLSLATIVNAAGPDMNRAETVTMFNDLLVMAPGAIPFAAVDWANVDEHTVRGTFTKGGDSVTAELTFNDAFELTNFVSDDRLRASSDGKSFTRQRWNTPITEYRQVGARKVAVAGDAQWYGPDPEGHFTYLEFKVDAIAYNVTSAALDAANRRLEGPSRPISHHPVVPTSAARQ